MSNWKYLNTCRVKFGAMASKSSDGFNGMFLLHLNGLNVITVASDGMGWRHVSVSLAKSVLRVLPPSWSIMSQVKDLFWEDEDCVVQFHPPKSQYVNNHPGCLHLWQPTGKQIKTPPWHLVGIRGVTPEQFEAAVLVGDCRTDTEIKCETTHQGPGNP